MPLKRDVLERPFDPALIRTRKGPFGQQIAYVEAVEVVKRLNAAGDWSFEIVQHEIRDLEVIVLGKLSVDGVVKMAFGSSAITTSRDTGEVLSLGRDLKAAATGALRKCAWMCGVPVYGDGQPTAEQPTAGGNGRDAGPPGNGSNGNGGNGHAPRSADRLTQRQLSAIFALARRLGLSGERLRQRCTASCGVPPQELSKTSASSFIEALQRESVAGSQATP